MARIQRWYVNLADGTAPYGGERGSTYSLSTSSIRSVVKIVLVSILDVAVEKRWIDANPVVKAKAPLNRAVKRRLYLTHKRLRSWRVRWMRPMSQSFICLSIRDCAAVRY